MQLGDLTIGEIKLFELTNGGLLPFNDEFLNYKARKKEAGAMEQVKDYYRAFGRLVAYCLLLSPENDGPLEVALNVLPALYQTGT